MCITADTADELGLHRHPPAAPNAFENADMWRYASLERPQGAPKSDVPSDWAASIYRGIVPAANILQRDFAVNGALVRTSLISPCHQSKSKKSGADAT